MIQSRRRILGRGIDVGAGIIAARGGLLSRRGSVNGLHEDHRAHVGPHGTTSVRERSCLDGTSSSALGGLYQGVSYALETLVVHQFRRPAVLMITDIDADSRVYAVTFSPTGEHLICGGFDGVRVWRVSDGKEVAKMAGRNVLCVAVSRDGRWMAAGSWVGQVYLWDGRTASTMDSEDSYAVNGVDFSHDGAKLVVASNNRTASIWDISTRRRLVSIPHARHVVAAKYAPQGDRIATAAFDGVRVFNADNGRLLLSVECHVTPMYHTGLLWSSYLFAVSDSAIQQLEPSTGSTVATCAVSETSNYACIALPAHGEFIAYAAKRTVAFWDTSTRTQLAVVQHTQDIRSMAFSPDNRFLAIAGRDGQIAIQNLSRIAESISLSGWEPHLQIKDAILDLWKQDQLTDAQALLDVAITSSDNPSHHLLASRALIRARLQNWDAALADAEKAIQTQPSIMGYIAKCVAHLGKGEKRVAYRTCDITFKCFCSLHDSFFRLIKAILVFMAGGHSDAVSRLDLLIDMAPSDSMCYIIQVYMYMHLFLGNACMERGDHSGAIQSFDHARAQIRHNTGSPLLAVSLITGWKFDNLNITIRQRRCEALYAAGRTQDACESVFELVDSLDQDTVSTSIVKWLSEFTHRCLSTSKSGDATTANRAQVTLDSKTAMPLLRVWATATLAINKWKDAMVSAASFTLPRASTYQIICERLEEVGHTADAIDCLQEMINELGDKFYSSKSMSTWVCDFTQRHLSSPVNTGYTPLKATPTSLLKEWARAKMTRSSWKDAMFAALDFTIPRVTVYQVVCEHLEGIDRTTSAVECFLQMGNELKGKAADLRGEHYQWAVAFRQRSGKKLERLGDAAMDAQRHDAAVSYYTAVLSLHLPVGRILLKRGKALLATGSWRRALDDANKVIASDPSSPWGYEMKHAALHKAGGYDSAINVFEMMLSKITQSSDPDVRRQIDRYISPSSTRDAIRRVVQRTIRHSPRVLINTTTGRLYHRAERVSVFECLPIFNELVSSMTTRIDYVHIKREVRKYFRYVMLSHRWEEDEPLFQDVTQVAVYDLAKSPTNDKLRTFCRIVRDAGFHWAWSDTCCINKSDNFVLQEALVAMFRWYQGAAMMIVYLGGVRSPAYRGALVKSVWNTRAWTLQEYVASKVIHFYTEDWIPYLDLKAANHKEAPEVISEMEQATGVPAKQLMALRPGLTSIREKLRLASTRQTTLVEDAAYSLLGIFSVSGLPAIYGEGESSLGRLLAHILAGSGDVSILAWTGESGGYNSCLPARISAFNGPATAHLPRPIPDAELERLITTSPLSAYDLEVAMRLYDRLNELPTPWFAASRMKLPCIAFQLPPLLPYRVGPGRAYRADTAHFGRMEVRTRQDLSRMTNLWLVHPWLDALLEREVVHGPGNQVAREEDGRPGSPEDDEDGSEEDTWSHTYEGHPAQTPAPAPAPIPLPTIDRETRARRLVGRLKQPFGALLVTLVATGRRAMDYRRVAADNVICVRFREGLGLSEILEGVRTLDVL